MSNYKILGVTAVVLALSASSATFAQEEPKAGTVAPGSLAGQTVVFASSGGIFQDGQKAAIWDPFEAESGVTVLQDASSFAKLRAGVETGTVAWDMVVLSNYMTYQFCGTLWEKIDTSIVDLSEVPPGLVTDECMIPAIVYSDMGVYNADLFPEGPTSWADFFDVEKFPGKRGLNMSADPSPAVVLAALMADGVAPADLYPIDFDRAFNKLRSLDEYIVPWSTGAQSQQQLESGETALAIVWSGRGYGAANAGNNIKPIWHDWLVAVDSVGIPKGAPNVAGAQAGLNYYLGATQTARLAELTSYGPVNTNAKPNLDSLVQEWVPTNERFNTAVYPDIAWWSANWDEFTEKWNDWVTGN